MVEEKKRIAKYNPEADKKWREKNRNKVNYVNDRSKARGFIKNKATSEDLEELLKLINERKEKLRKEEKCL